MRWVEDYQLFLFDLDGLLVNTEEIHYFAYKKMCAGRGFALSWDFVEYCLKAHYDSERLRKSIYSDIPQLYEMEPNWEVLYREKKDAMLDLLNEGAVHMMPGAEELLHSLAEADIPRCVVTNSPDEQIQLIRKKNAVLDTIPHWFTRETYSHPKPHPECYLNAIKTLGGSAEKVIGFEDTPKGLTALMQTRAKPVFISQVEYPEIPEYIAKGVLHFGSLESLSGIGTVQK
ncbi:MAG: Phosphorylated carbohydrates phosphatase [Chlamydiae bacterium]|nr:Phosphorylated carbohydrates phosphatase [Chlamydiota bacterium]